MIRARHIISNANKLPVLTERIVDKSIECIRLRSSPDVIVVEAQPVHAVFNGNNSADISTVFANVMDNRVFGHDSTGVNVIFVAGNTAAIGIIDVGFIKLNLDIAHRECICGGLSVGEVCQRCADDCGCGQCHAEAQSQNFLLHWFFPLILLFSGFAGGIT